MVLAALVPGVGAPEVDPISANPAVIRPVGVGAPRLAVTVPAGDAAAAAPRVTGEIARDLVVPWGLDFLPDGAALATERDTGRVLHITPQGIVTEIGRVPASTEGAEGGLLGLAISPRFTTDRLVYFYYSTRTENRVERGVLDDAGRLGPLQPVITGIPSASLHDGGRIEFGPDGTLFIGTGDASRPELAQDPASLAGKILRVTPDGAPAPGNPFPGSPVFSLGHRNVQGLAFDADGRLWASEHGARRWDELNHIFPGGNYGWPRVEGRGGGGRFIEPVVVWPVAEASPSGIAIVGGAVYMAGLRGQRLWRIPLSGETAGRPEAVLTGQFGRLRTVEPAGDGTLWLTTSNRDGRGSPRPGDDRILRVQP